MSQPRVVHCMREPYDVYIGRGRDPKRGTVGPWGNQYSHLPNSLAEMHVSTRSEAIEKYREWLYAHPEVIELAKKELRGKILGCWCAPKPCHGDVLLEVANAGD